MAIDNVVNFLDEVTYSHLTPPAIGKVKSQETNKTELTLEYPISDISHFEQLVFNKIYSRI